MSIGAELAVLGLLFVIAYGLGRLGKRIGLPAIPIPLPPAAEITEIRGVAIGNRPKRPPSRRTPKLG